MTEIPVKLERLIEGSKHMAKIITTMREDVLAAVEKDTNPTPRDKENYEKGIAEVDEALRKQNLFTEILEDLKGHPAFSYVKVNVEDFDKLGVWMSPPPKFND